MGIESVRLIQSIINKAEKGMTDRDVAKIVKTFTKQGLAQKDIVWACNAFKDRIVDGSEWKQLTSRFTLSSTAQASIRRIIGQHGLRMFGNTQSIVSKISLLADPDAATRKAAAGFILENAAKVAQNAQAKAYVRRLLVNGSTYARWVSAQVLGAIKDQQSIAALTDRVKDKKENEYVRRSSAEAIAKMKTKSATGAFANVLADQTDNINVRRAAAMALGKSGDPKATTPLIRALSDKNWRIRYAAVWALRGNKKATPHLVKILNNKKENFNVRYATNDYLRWVDDPAVKRAYAARLRDTKEDRWLRKQAVSMVAWAERIKVLKDADPDIREEAASWLGSPGCKSAVPALLPLVFDKDDSVRAAAVKSLSSIGDRRAIPALIRFLNKVDIDMYDGVKHAIWALGDFKDKRAYSALRRIFTHERAIAPTHEAARALIQLGGAKVYKLFVAALLGRVQTTVRRSQIVSFMGDLKDSRAVAPLIRLYRKATRSEKGEIIDALGKIGHKKAVPFLISVITNDKKRCGKSWTVWAMSSDSPAYKARSVLNEKFSKEPKVKKALDKFWASCKKACKCSK